MKFPPPRLHLQYGVEDASGQIEVCGTLENAVQHLLWKKQKHEQDRANAMVYQAQAYRHKVGLIKEGPRTNEPYVRWISGRYSGGIAQRDQKWCIVKRRVSDWKDI